MKPKVDVVIMDACVGMTVPDASDLIIGIRKSFPKLEIWGSSYHPENAPYLTKAGCNKFVPKEDVSKKLISMLVQH